MLWSKKKNDPIRRLWGAFVFAAAASADAQGPSDYDFDFATVGAVGNAPYTGVTPGSTQGRGRVDYEFRIARFEVTTSQWLEFINVYATQGLNLPLTRQPTFWGGERDPTYQGPGVRYRLSSLPSAGLLPVTGFTWRDAAMFTNWLHNSKQPTLAAIENGAYATSTFTINPDRSFNDQRTHHPDARFWIPSLDEIMKAGHYDPDRFGPRLGGWWEQKNRSDLPGIAGPPGVGTTSAGWIDPVNPLGEIRIPLGSYPMSLSPWGLLDTSGGTAEMTEYYGPVTAPRDRGEFGLAAGQGISGSDPLDLTGSTPPDLGAPLTGLRIASAVPVPATLFVLVPLSLFIRRRQSARRD